MMVGVVECCCVFSFLEAWSCVRREVCVLLEDGIAPVRST